MKAGSGAEAGGLLSSSIPLALPVVFLVMWLLLTGCAESPPGERVMIGLNVEGLPGDQSLNTLREETGVHPDIVGFYLQWPSRPQVADLSSMAASLAAISSAGAVPLVTWEPMAVTGDRETVIPAGEILSGTWEPYITAFAHTVASAGGSVIVRFGHEMNLGRYHWGVPEENFNEEAPAIYRSIYRKVVADVERAGASNIVWFFCPNSESMPGASTGAAYAWNTIQAWYPGSDVVDIAGLDGYNWGDTRIQAKHGWDSSWRSFSEIFETPLSELETVVGSIPVMIGETGSAHSGGNRESWLREALEFCRRRRVRGMLWFQANKEVDWRLTASEATLLRNQ